MKKIVITGSCGFVGQQLVAALRILGHNVWGIDLIANADDCQSIQANFLDPQSTYDAFKKIGSFETLIHLAAVAHHQKIDSHYNECTINVEITRNIINSCCFTENIIFFSSVAVYGEENQSSPVHPSAGLHPSSLYGEGKKQCEKLIMESKKYRNVTILRPAPIYDESHKTDIIKRVYLPTQLFKMALYPSPSYSFCHIDTIIKKVSDTVEHSPTGRNIMNVADDFSYRQSDIRREFSGVTLPVFVPLLMPFYFILKLIPGEKSYKIRSLFRKLFTNCLYSLETIELS